MRCRRVENCMNRRVLSFAAVILGLALLEAPLALGQSVSYPDAQDYQQFRRQELDTLQALSKDPSRAITFRLLMAHRRLRESQLMVAKEKLNLVPGLLKDYQETIQGIRDYLQTIPTDLSVSVGYNQTIKETMDRQRALLQTMARRVPTDLHPSIESALEISHKLEVVSIRTPLGQAAPSSGSLTRTRGTTFQTPIAPEQTGVQAQSPETPLLPPGTTRQEVLEPPAPEPAPTPDDTLGRRLRPGETHTRGTRRPDDTHPRPRAREPYRPLER